MESSGDAALAPSVSYFQLCNKLTQNLNSFKQQTFIILVSGAQIWVQLAQTLSLTRGFSRGHNHGAHRDYSHPKAQLADSPLPRLITWLLADLGPLLAVEALVPCHTKRCSGPWLLSRFLSLQ